MSAATDGVLVFAHIGDLHITDAKQPNFRDFLSIVAQIEVECRDSIDFVCLPGDNADNGRPSQYALVATALKMLSVPVHVITGDHDMEQGDLGAFYAMPGAAPLPNSVTVQDARCLFLDMCGQGQGGPDFRLGAFQVAWLKRELDAAGASGQTSLVFMHSYPADLVEDAETEAVNRLIGAHDVALVDMGHTHYNELANDGRAIFAATRSTGQIEEGPVGYSIASLDGGVVSWRFKLLDDPFPFVMITRPADYRLIRRPDHTVAGECEVRAFVLGRRDVREVACRIEDGEAVPMRTIDGGRIWSALVSVPERRLATLTVQAIDSSGRPGQHSIRIASPAQPLRDRARDGSDAASIGAWPENGIFATQLGPNRNGKPSS